MSALKGLFVFASLFVTTAYAAPSVAYLVELHAMSIICMTLALAAMMVSNIYFADDKNCEYTDIVAILAAMATGLVGIAIVALNTSLALVSFTTVLAALVIATIAAFFATASHLTLAVDRKVYVVASVVFYGAIIGGFVVLCFCL